MPREIPSDLALLHLWLLQQAQGTTETVTVTNDCPRCRELMACLPAAEEQA